MRIFHTTPSGVLYIEVPSPDPNFYPLDKNNHLLVEYYTGKKEYIEKHKIFADLIMQMMYHDAFDEFLLYHYRDEILHIPTLIRRISAQTIIACLDNGVKFTDAEQRILDYDTIEEIPYWKFINDSHLQKFKSLRRLDLSSSSYVTDTGIEHLTSLQSLNISDTHRITLKFLSNSSHRHPWCDGMLELNIDDSSVPVEILKLFTRLKKFIIYDQTDLDFIIPKVSIFVRSPLSTDAPTKIDIALTSKQYPVNGEDVVIDLSYGNQSPYSIVVPKEIFHPLRESIEELTIGNDEYDYRQPSIISYFRSIRRLTTGDFSFLKDPEHPLNYTIEELRSIGSQNAGIENLRNLRKLDCRSWQGSALSNGTDALRASDTVHSHPLCASLEELYMGPRMDEVGLKYFRNLRKLDISMTKISLSFLDPDHPMCETLTHLKSNGRVKETELSNLKSLKYFRDVPKSKIRFSFLTEDHPLCETMEDFHPGERVNDEISMFRRLRTLTINGSVNFDFLNNYQTPGNQHPLCLSLEELSLKSISNNDNLQYLQRLRKLHLRDVRAIKFLEKYPRHSLLWTLEELFVKHHPRENDFYSLFQRLQRVTYDRFFLKMDENSPLCGRYRRFPDWTRLIN